MEPDFALMSESFSAIEDPRKAGMTTYSADHLIFMTLCGLLCGCDTWVKIADHVSFRSRLFTERFGLESTPSHDTFARFFGLINTKQFKQCFAEWVTRAYKGCGGKIVAIDGKSIQSNIKDVATRYIVSAFVAGDNIILDQVVTDSKSNEITAVPELLNALNLEGATVTMDAMGLQKKNIEHIVKKKADYVIALKGNQGNLHAAVKDFFDDFRSPDSSRDAWDRDYQVNVPGILEMIPDLTVIVVEGGGNLAMIWEREAQRRGLTLVRISAESWRQPLLYLREQRSGADAKKHAGEMARKVIAWSKLPGPTSLRHDAAEAIMAGLWGLLQIGRLEALPRELHR